jgi:hypothetical protein
MQTNGLAPLPDSGTRATYETGAQRDNRVGKGRYDLISPYALKRLALRLEAGAEKYSDRNWEKGMPLARYLDALIRHTQQLLMGDTTEDHASAVMFNIMAYMHTEEMLEKGLLPEELDDLPDYEGRAEVVQWAQEFEIAQVAQQAARRARELAIFAKQPSYDYPGEAGSRENGSG